MGAEMKYRCMQYRIVTLFHNFLSLLIFLFIFNSHGHPYLAADDSVSISLFSMGGRGRSALHAMYGHFYLRQNKVLLTQPLSAPNFMGQNNRTVSKACVNYLS